MIMCTNNSPLVGHSHVRDHYFTYGAVECYRINSVMPSDVTILLQPPELGL
jgi:hypothetical protein